MEHDGLPVKVGLLREPPPSAALRGAVRQSLPCTLSTRFAFIPAAGCQEDPGLLAVDSRCNVAKGDLQTVAFTRRK